jgi:hypothetical protein
VTSEHFLIAYVVFAILGGAVFIHADRNGSRHPTAWAIVVFFFGVLALPVYALHVYLTRRRRRRR